MGRFSFSRRRPAAPEALQTVVAPPDDGAALLHRISVALETPRLSSHGYPQTPPGLSLERSNSRAVSSTLTLPITATQTPTTATTPTDPHNPYSANRAEISVSTPELPPAARPNIGKKRISMQYLNPFASRSKAALEPTPGPTLSDVTNSAESHSPVSEKRAEDAKPKKKLSKRQAAPPPPTSTSLKNLLSGTPVSHPSSGTTPADLHRAKKVASSQARLVPLLLHEEEANRLIVEVRQLSPVAHYFPPSLAASSPNLNAAGVESSRLAHPPAVRAVCLAQTDEETDALFLSKIPTTSPSSAPDSSAATIATNIDTLAQTLSQIKLINFLQFRPHPHSASETSPLDSEDSSSSPDIAPIPPKIGEPSAASALDATLLGAIPSPRTVEKGVDEMAKQMIALGLGNPSALLGPSAPKLEDLLPSHAGVYPPEDRMSVITYWWGYELVLPEPSIRYLSKVKSIEGTVLNFLTIFSMMSGGIREVMPFIRYAAQYVDIEWATIKAKDKGKGVVCAATWLMPAALVARSWDFPSLTPDPEEEPETVHPHPHGLAHGHGHGSMHTPVPQQNMAYAPALDLSAPPPQPHMQHHHQQHQQQHLYPMPHPHAMMQPYPIVADAGVSPVTPSPASASAAPAPFYEQQQSPHQHPQHPHAMGMPGFAPYFPPGQMGQATHTPPPFFHQHQYQYQQHQHPHQHHQQAYFVPHPAHGHEHGYHPQQQQHQPYGTESGTIDTSSTSTVMPAPTHGHGNGTPSPHKTSFGAVTTSPTSTSASALRTQRDNPRWRGNGNVPPSSLLRSRGQQHQHQQGNGTSEQQHQQHRGGVLHVPHHTALGPSSNPNANSSAPYNTSFGPHQGGGGGWLGPGAGLTMGGRKPTPEANIVDVDRIEQGVDTRTTVMLKNVPNKMTAKDLISFIHAVVPGALDFLYLRIDFTNQCNVGYAFVNFIDANDLLKFCKACLGKKWNLFQSEKVLQMSYANYQGKDALVDKFRNSAVLNERPEWRPQLFHSHGPNRGQPHPFPAPNSAIRRERSAQLKNTGMYSQAPRMHAPMPPPSTSLPPSVSGRAH